jgi:hypothetical protein
MTYKLNRRCPVCDKLLNDMSKTGFFGKHRDRSGKNNPFLKELKFLKMMGLLFL